jgi:hypothetical protein
MSATDALTRKIISAPTDKWADLPAHEFEFEVCTHCGTTQSHDTYEDYLIDFYNDWERGETGKTPDSEEEFHYLQDSCLDQPLEAN